MIRKWMTVLLSLMLALALPLTVFAEKLQHTLTIEPGDDLASIQALADIFDVLSLTFTSGEKSGALTLTLDGTDVATIALGADVTGLYAQSNLLSDEVLYVTWDDGFAFLSGVLSSAATDEASAAAVEAMEDSLTEAKAAIVSTMQNGMPASQPKNSEELVAMFEQMFPNDPKMIEYAQGIYDKLVVEEGTFEAAGRDTAAWKQSLTMTGEDFVAVAETNYMRSMMEQILKQESPELQGAELNAAIDELIAEVVEVYQNNDIQVSVEAYATDEAMTDPVGMAMRMQMNIAEEGETINAVMSMDYNRLTDVNGVSHKALMNMTIDQENAMDLLFDLYKGADDVSTGMLSMLVEGEQITITYDAANTGSARNRAASLYMRSGASAIIEPAASERPLITFNVQTQPADPAVLAQIDTADAHSAVNVMKLSEEEMQTLVSGIVARAQQIYSTALSKLPPSVFGLLFSGIN